MTEPMIDGDPRRAQEREKTEPPGVGELIQRIALDARVLARDEVALAKLELAQAAQRTVVSIAAIVLGGVLALISLGLLCMTAVAALAPLVPALWARMLIMSFAYLCLATLLGGVFLARLRSTPMSLPETRAEAKETLHTVAAEVHHG